MFREDEFTRRIRQKPFEPFRIIVSEGLSYDISHPDLVMVGERGLTIGYASEKHPRVCNRVVTVSYVHIVAIDQLPAPEMQAANGAAH